MRLLLALTVLAMMLFVVSAESKTADELLAVDAGGAHAEESSRQARQFGFGRGLFGRGFGRRGGFGRGYGGYGGYGGGYGGGFGGPFGGGFGGPFGGFFG